MFQVSDRLYKLSESSGHKCYWCGGIVNLVDCDHPLAATREHLIPKSLRGKRKDKNVVLAHRQCNMLGATMNADGFRKLMDGVSVTKYDLWPHIYKHEHLQKMWQES